MPADPSPDYFDLDAMALRCERFRAAGKRVVLAHGCFDLLHLGHVRYLNAARALGDALLVTLTPDRFVDKGADRPAFGEHERAEMVNNLVCVDAVAINRWPTAEQTLALVRPDVYAKGAEYRAAADDPATAVGRERAAVEAAGGEMVFIDTPKLSSTQLLGKLRG